MPRKPPLYPHKPRGGGHNSEDPDEIENILWGGKVDAWRSKDFLTDPRVFEVADKLHKATQEVYDQFLKLESIEDELLRKLEEKYSRRLPAGGGHMEPGHPMTLLDEAHWALDAAVRAIYKEIGLRYPD